MTTAGAAGRPMSLWRLEWLRLIRTPRAVSLCAVFVSIGLIEPVVTKYQGKLLAHVGKGITIIAPPPTPADGLNGYVSEIMLIGLILVVVLAAGALTFDASQGRAIFLRTRVPGSWRLIAPRVAVSAAAAIVAYGLGTVAAWYETSLLLGPLPAARMLAGLLCAAAYLTFAVAVTALASALTRTTLATAGTAFVVLLALPVLGTVHVLERWLPSALVDAPVELANGAHQLAYFWPALVVAAAATVGALAMAAARLTAREV